MVSNLSFGQDPIVGYQIAEEAATGKLFVAVVQQSEADGHYDPNNWFPTEAAAQASIDAKEKEDEVYAANMRGFRESVEHQASVNNGHGDPS